MKLAAGFFFGERDDKEVKVINGSCREMESE